VLSFYCNIEISDTESNDTNKSRWLLNSYWLQSLPSSTTPLVPEYRLSYISTLWSGKCPGEKCVRVTQNFPKYLKFRITEGLLYYSGINCNWKLILECCVRFVAYRVKSNFYAVGVFGCVWWNVYFLWPLRYLINTPSVTTKRYAIGN
jgi:hypothetical protein